MLKSSTSPVYTIPGAAPVLFTWSIKQYNIKVYVMFTEAYKFLSCTVETLEIHICYLQRDFNQFKVYKLTVELCLRAILPLGKHSSVSWSPVLIFTSLKHRMGEDYILGIRYGNSKMKSMKIKLQSPSHTNGTCLVFQCFSMSGLKLNHWFANF